MFFCSVFQVRFMKLCDSNDPSSVDDEIFAPQKAVKKENVKVFDQKDSIIQEVNGALIRPCSLL